MEQSSYTAFAYVYDEFMDNVPYEEWAEYLISLLFEHGVRDGLVCELGCGTGQMTRRLSAAGYDMIGIDLSEDMLEIAREQEMEASAEEPAGKEILYLQQDMRSFELYGTVAAVVSICDSMNYITEKEDLRKVFSLVNNYLDPNGIFIFDLNTVQKYRKIGDCTIAENREDASFIWENSYDEETRRNEYALTLYIKAEGQEKKAQPLYERYEEVHIQRAYLLSEIKELLAEAGMNFLAAYQVMTKDAPGEDCERMYIIASEGFQKNKSYVTVKE